MAEAADGTGAHTIVAGQEADDARLELASRIGAARIVNVEQEDVLEVVREATGGKGADIAIEGRAAQLRCASVSKLFGGGSPRQVSSARKSRSPWTAGFTSNFNSSVRLGTRRRPGSVR